MAHELDKTRVFDVNGTKYRVGLDEYGYVQIQQGELRRDPESGEDTFYAYDAEDGIIPHIMLSEAVAPEIADYIAELAE